jgi:hypothetical protein
MDLSNNTNSGLLGKRWENLNRRVSQYGVAELPRWAAQWIYWNSGVRPLADRLGLKPKRYGISEPILVFQMAKVGSTSVYDSLNRLHLAVPIYHLHLMNDLDELEKEYSNPPIPKFLQDIQTARIIRRDMARHPSKCWNVITLVRPPIPRMASTFFESLDRYVPNAVERYAAGTLKVQEIISYFLNDYNDTWTDTWFDIQMQGALGFDVFATPFDKARGYQIYHQRNIHILVVRLDDLSRRAPQAMHEFLGIPDFELFTRNVGEAKTSGALYQAFLQELRLTPSMVERWHTSRFARHFYTPEELAASVARWT